MASAQELEGAVRWSLISHQVEIKRQTHSAHEGLLATSTGAGHRSFDSRATKAHETLDYDDGQA